MSLAGVLDLKERARLGLGRGAVCALLGGENDERPERYDVSSPTCLLPIGVHQLLVHGAQDSVVPMSMSDACRAQELIGDPVELELLAGVGHMGLIDTAEPGWQRVIAHLAQVLEPEQGLT